MTHPLKTYKFTAPTWDECKALGIQPEGLETRIRMFIIGVAFALTATSTGFNVCFTNNANFTVECNHSEFMTKIIQRLESYGYACEIVDSR